MNLTHIERAAVEPESMEQMAAKRLNEFCDNAISYFCESVRADYMAQVVSDVRFLLTANPPLSLSQQKLRESREDATKPLLDAEGWWWDETLVTEKALLALGWEPWDKEPICLGDEEGDTFPEYDLFIRIRPWCGWENRLAFKSGSVWAVRIGDPDKYDNIAECVQLLGNYGCLGKQATMGQLRALLFSVGDLPVPTPPAVKETP